MVGTLALVFCGDVTKINKIHRIAWRPSTTHQPWGNKARPVT